MTQPGSLPSFVLTLRSDSDSNPYLVSCAIDGKDEGRGFHAATRRFKSPDEVAAALKNADIDQKRYQDAFAKVGDGSEASFDIDQNEGQRLGILHTDTSE